jgi:hypothetical protein
VDGRGCHGNRNARDFRAANVANFDEFWAIAQLAPSLRPTTAGMSSQNMERLKARVHARLTADAAGRITYTARANAIKGRKS